MSNIKYASILITHWANESYRGELVKASLASLYRTLDYPAEIIVVDNGEFEEDTNWFVREVRAGRINHLIVNKENMHFYHARNQAMGICTGDYIVIADNDIFYEQAWLRPCIQVIEKYPDRQFFTTPIYGNYGIIHRFDGKEDYPIGNKVWKANYRAGSNCFVGRRNDIFNVGMFPRHIIAGSKWNDKAVKLGYTFVYPPKNLVRDMATFDSSYHKKKVFNFKRTLFNGEVLELEPYGQDK